MLPTRYCATNHNFEKSKRRKIMTRVKNEVINVRVVLKFSHDIDNTARNFNSATVHTRNKTLILMFRHVSEVPKVCNTRLPAPI
jgi:hypothetical protein